MKNVRASFRIIRNSICGYDVECVICEKQSVAWDYRHNALLVGWLHVLNEHTPKWLQGARWC